MLFTKEEYKQRLKKVQASMQEKGIDLLISQEHYLFPKEIFPKNVEYLNKIKDLMNLKH